MGQLEQYAIKGKTIQVYRDDLSFPPPAPSFGKIRGLMDRLRSLKAQGIKYVGYTETAISMAGWGVAWGCEQLGMKAVIYNPIYKHKTSEVLEMHRTHWQAHKAEIIAIPASMAKVNFYICKNDLKKRYPFNSIMLPLGLPFSETISATSILIQEVIKTAPQRIPLVVVNVGSGTITAGIWKGLDELAKRRGGITVPLIGVMGRTSNVKDKATTIRNKAGLNLGIFESPVKLLLVDEGWQYMDKSIIECPFPCHPYYDLKAWQWLIDNIKIIPDGTLFWNIGSLPSS